MVESEDFDLFLHKFTDPLCNGFFQLLQVYLQLSHGDVLDVFFLVRETEQDVAKAVLVLGLNILHAVVAMLVRGRLL